MSKFTLMNKNKKIFDFDYDEEEHFIVKFERNYLVNEKYAPFGLIKDDNIDIIFHIKSFINNFIGCFNIVIIIIRCYR